MDSIVNYAFTLYTANTYTAQTCSETTLIQKEAFGAYAQKSEI